MLLGGFVIVVGELPAWFRIGYLLWICMTWIHALDLAGDDALAVVMNPFFLSGAVTFSLPLLLRLSGSRSDWTQCGLPLAARHESACAVSNAGQMRAKCIALLFTLELQSNLSLLWHRWSIVTTTPGDKYKYACKSWSPFSVAPSCEPVFVSFSAQPAWPFDLFLINHFQQQGGSSGTKA